jgi:hypothetical protein
MPTSPDPERRLARRALGTNTLSIVHTGRSTSISSAKITHHTISVAKSSQTSAICNCYRPKKKIESGTNLLDFRS